MDDMDKKVIAKVMELMDRKGSLYSSEPVKEWPIDILLAFVYGKATRASRKIDAVEKRQELYDTIVYSIKALARLETEDTVKQEVK
jgi:hypothetical protein